MTRPSHKGSHSLATSTLVMTLSFSAYSAHAQAVDPAYAQNNSGTQISEIVVTAQKRPENILFVPESVTCLSSDGLEAQHATQLQDYAAYAPGLQVDCAGNSGQTTVTLRDIAPLGSGTAVGTRAAKLPAFSNRLRNCRSGRASSLRMRRSRLESRAWEPSRASDCRWCHAFVHQWVLYTI